MKPLTINELYNECKKQISKGNGNKTIMISQDDEGNRYHYLWYMFATPEELLLEKNEIDEEVAKYEDTIILG